MGSGTVEGLRGSRFWREASGKFDLYASPDTGRSVGNWSGRGSEHFFLKFSNFRGYLTNYRPGMFTTDKNASKNFPRQKNICTQFLRKSHCSEMVKTQLPTLSSQFVTQNLWKLFKLRFITIKKGNQTLFIKHFLSNTFYQTLFIKHFLSNTFYSSLFHQDTKGAWTLDESSDFFEESSRTFPFYKNFVKFPSLFLVKKQSHNKTETFTFLSQAR